MKKRNQHEEGYIKFNCNWIKAKPFTKNNLSALNKWRDILYNKGLIGAYDNGIGFGNVSIRISNRSFLITGSATGKLSKLNEKHYVLVNEYDLMQNELTCVGPIKASSESLSHAAIYECSPKINAVFHIHNNRMWKKHIHAVPTTNEDVLYGTPEMAIEIKRLFEASNVMTEKIIVMGGHKDGIISFGETLEQVGKVFLERL